MIEKTLQYPIPTVKGSRNLSVAIFKNAKSRVFADDVLTNQIGFVLQRMWLIGKQRNELIKTDIPQLH